MGRSVSGSRRSRALASLAIASCLVAPSFPRVASAQAAGSGEGASRLAEQYATQVRAFLPLLKEGGEPALLPAALGDVRRAVAEIDQVVAGIDAPAESGGDPGPVRTAAATAHLHLALFETRTNDFVGARKELDRARQILGGSTAQFRTAWASEQSGGPGQAPVTRYELRSFVEFETLLKSAWSKARQVAFDLNTVTPRDCASLKLSENPGAPVRDSDHLLVERAAALLKEAIEAGQRTFSVPLPPGAYYLGGRAGSGLERTFLVPEAAESDPVVVGTERFALQFELGDRARMPRLFLNGVEVTDMTSMPYGYYRVKSDEQFVQDAPRLIRFIPGLGIDNRSRSSWTVFVPKGELTVLRLGMTPTGGRRHK